MSFKKTKVVNFENSKLFCIFVKIQVYEKKKQNMF